MFVNGMVVRDGSLCACVEKAKMFLLAFNRDLCFISILPLAHPTIPARISRHLSIVYWCVSRWHLLRKVQFCKWSAKFDGSSIVRFGSLLGSIVRAKIFLLAINPDPRSISFSVQIHANVTSSTVRSYTTTTTW